MTSIAFLVAENPIALMAVVQDSRRHVAERRQPHQDGQDQQGRSSVVEAGGKLYSATKEVKVTVGGCGG